MGGGVRAGMGGGEGGSIGMGSTCGIGDMGGNGGGKVGGQRGLPCELSRLRFPRGHPGLQLCSAPSGPSSDDGTCYIGAFERSQTRSSRAVLKLPGEGF